MPKYAMLAAAAVMAAVPLAQAAPGHDHAAGHEGGFAFGRPGQPEAASRELTISMQEMEFAPTLLHARAGETVRFVIRNASAADHDFTLGDAATQAAHRAEMAAMPAEAAKAHGSHAANAVLVPAGETRALTWTFTRAGSVEFACNLPGHYEAGMRGTIEVDAR